MFCNINEFEETIKAFHELILQAPEKYTSIKPEPDKWSLKEIVGHLIDSASNNHQRFVRLQEGNLLSFPGYHQEDWVRIQKHNAFDWQELVELWGLYNSLLIHVIKSMDENSLGNVWNINGEEMRLDWLVNDYFTHMRWHINHFEERLGEINNIYIGGSI